MLTPKPKKALGQNFLVDQCVIRETIEAAQIGNDDVVVEVGAGTGTLTYPLAKRAKKVVAVEIDKDLIPELQTKLRGLQNVEIVNEDFLILDPSRYTLDPSFKVVGSIPYQITSPLIHKLLRETPRPRSITIIVQKEVAEKITAKPPKGTYLSNFVANFGKAEIIRTIKPSAFRPQPKVDSALLHINLYSKSYTPNPERLSALLHHGFAQPRKMLNKRFSPEILQKLGISPERRPQTLHIGEWLKLLEVIKDGGASSKATPSPPPPSSDS